MINKITKFTLIITILLISIFLYSKHIFKINKRNEESNGANSTVQEPSEPNNITTEEKKCESVKISDSLFSDDFNCSDIIEESSSMGKSKNPVWWVDSGAFLYIENGIARTISGKLNENDPWRIKYLNYNSDETEKGYRPQNIFRLITRSDWKNFEQEAHFNLKDYSLSSSIHRAASNGLLLFNRYYNENNLYYTGIRVDGTAIIKKKIKGNYFTMVEKTIIPGKYNRDTNPNLLPKNKWLGLKSIVKDNPDGTVNIELYTDMENNGNWTLVAKAIDDNKTYGGKAITDSNYAGIRTDFMDVEFDNYKISELK